MARLPKSNFDAGGDGRTMKLLYLIKQPLVERDYNRFGIKFFLDKGHDVTVLDLSDLIHPQNPNDRSNVIQDSRLTLRIIQNRAELKAKKETFTENDLVFVLIFSLRLTPSTYPILRILGKTETPYLIIAPPLYPGATLHTTKMSSWLAIKETFIRLKKMDLLNSILGRLPRQLLGIPEAKYIVYNGHTSLKKTSLVGNKTIPIYAHTADFDLYFDHAKIKVEPEPQAVFIDQYLPHHPDFFNFNVACRIEPDAYYRRLRVLFDRIERELNLKVVIAGHPRSDYHRFNGVFGDREIHYGDTINQIAKSRLVLAHYSTAIGFAVLYRKPVIILTTKEFYDKIPINKKHAFEGFSNDLNAPLKYFDNPDDVDLSDVLSVNDELYERYIHKYMKTPESPSKPLWDIVYDAIVAEHSGPKN